MNILPKRIDFATITAGVTLLAWSSTGAGAQDVGSTALAQGISYAFSTPEYVVAAVALGIGFEQLGRRSRNLAFALLILGAAVGMFLTRVDWIDFETLLLALLFLVPGPLFITASLPLLAFKWRPTIAMAVAASAIGALFGFAIALEGMSTDDGMWFTLGAGTTAVIAGLAVAIGWRRFARSWFALPVRIRSWILAIGIMLTAIGVQTFHMADPKDFYEEMVAAGGGRMLGQFMLAGWKNMHPDEQYFSKFIDLYEHIEDKCYIERTEQFERWYENPIDLPGRYYLQAIQLLFQENRFAKGEFVGLGRTLSLKTIRCPVFLLAGEPTI